MSASSVTRAVTGVHLKVHPRPRNLYESRGILRLLNKYGEVTFFQHQLYNLEKPAPNTFFATFKEPQSVENLIKESPIHFSIPPRPSSGAVKGPISAALTGLFGPDEEIGQSNNQGEHKTPSDIAENDKVSTENPREFQLFVDELNKKLDEEMKRGPYYWDFNRERDSFPTESLINDVPAPGLASISLKRPPTFQRIVRKKQLEIDKRQTLRQMYESAASSAKTNTPS